MSRVPPRLAAKWQARLAASGFKDIEDSKGNLKSYHSRMFQDNNSPVSFKAKQKYYELAGQLLFKHTFRSKRDRYIWELHANGHTDQEIAKRVSISPRRVDQIIETIEEHLYCGDSCTKVGYG